MRSAAFQVVAIGSPSPARAGTSRRASARLTPPPSRSTGRRAASTAATTSALIPEGSADTDVIAAGASSTAEAACASKQNSTKTGPGRPERARRTTSITADLGSGWRTRTAPTVTGAASAIPSISWIPRCRRPPPARSLLFTCPPTTNSSRLSRKAPAIAVRMFVRPGPAVTSAKARPAPGSAASLKYSAAIPAATSCTNGTHVIRVRTESSRCMTFPPATKKQCV